jgi:hypothetical protein
VVASVLALGVYMLNKFCLFYCYGLMARSHRGMRVLLKCG